MSLFTFKEGQYTVKCMGMGRLKKCMKKNEIKACSLKDMINLNDICATVGTDFSVKNTESKYQTVKSIFRSSTTYKSTN